MQGRSIITSKAFLAVLALVTVAPFVYFIIGRRDSAVPRTVAIRGGLSNLEAHSLYTSLDGMLRTLYWQRVRANLRAGQFRELWLNVRRGPERIQTLSKEDEGYFVVYATNRLGGSCTITTRELSAPQLDGAWKAQSPVVQQWSRSVTTETNRTPATTPAVRTP
jgi:hypothetical protein